MFSGQGTYARRRRRGVSFVETVVGVAAAVVVGGAIVAALGGAVNAGTVRHARCIVGLAAADACAGDKGSLSGQVAVASITPVPPSEGVVCNAMGCTEAGNCFVPGTPVLTPRGLVPIEALVVGDEVLSHDGGEDDADARHVIVATKRTPGRPVVDVQLRSMAGTIDHVRATLEHPFYVRGRGFVTTADLALGDAIDAVLPGSVDALTLVAETSDVYNLEIADVHTYRVGRLGALVHNQCIPRQQGTSPFPARQTFNAPQPQTFNAPRTTFPTQPFNGAPQQSFNTAPRQTFSAPRQSFNAPQQPQVFSSAPRPQTFTAPQQQPTFGPARQATFGTPVQAPTTSFTRQDKEYAVHRVADGKSAYTLVQQQNQNGCGPATLAAFLDDATRGRLVVEDKPANAGALSWELRGTLGTAVDGPTPSMKVMVDTANRVGVRAQEAKSFADAIRHANQPGGAIVGMYNVDPSGKPLVDAVGHVVRVVKTDGNKVLVVDPMETKPYWLDKKEIERRYMGLGMYAK